MNDFELDQKIGSRLKRIREDKGMSLRNVSDLVGISHAYLSNVENAKKTLSFSYLNTMLKFYKVSFADFFKELKE